MEDGFKRMREPKVRIGCIYWHDGIETTLKHCRFIFLLLFKKEVTGLKWPHTRFYFWNHYEMHLTVLVLAI